MGNKPTSKPTSKPTRKPTDEDKSIEILYNAIDTYIDKLHTNIRDYISNEEIREKLTSNDTFNQGVIDRLINQPDIFIPIFVKFIACAFANIRRKSTGFPEQWYIAQDITENVGDLSISNYRIHNTLTDIILHTICTNKSILHNFVNRYEKEFINIVCSNTLRLGVNVSLYTKGTDRLIGPERFTALLIHMISVSKLFSFSPTDPTINSINQAKTITFLKDNPIDSLVMLGSCLDIIRKELNAKLTEVAAKDRETMKSLLEYAHKIDKKLCIKLNKKFKIKQKHSLILKGGNVFKIYLENTVDRLKSGQLAIPKAYEELGNLLTPEKSLSDWDFSLDTHGVNTTYNGVTEDMMTTTQNIFTHPNISVYLKANRAELSSRIRDYLKIYSYMRLYIVKKNE
jgi:hypothetical protein